MYRLTFTFLAFAVLGRLATASILPTDPNAVQPLAVGATAPTAALPSIDGSVVDLAALIAAKPTVLIFYRGGWCPFCNRHLAALAESELDLRRLGWQIVAVSPDNVAALARTAAEQHLRYRLLSDSDLKISAAYSVAFRITAEGEKAYRQNGIHLPQIPGSPDYWQPIPTAFLIGRDGRIKFVYSNADPSKPISTEDLLKAAAIDKGE